MEVSPHHPIFRCLVLANMFFFSNKFGENFYLNFDENILFLFCSNRVESFDYGNGTVSEKE